MHALIIGAGMGGLGSALALRQSGKFDSISVFEQTRSPSTAGAGLNIAPNGARICQWLGVDLDGGDPKGPHGAVDGGRASILSHTRQIMADGTISQRPIDHTTAAGDGAGFHHMHRLDLLMALYKRAYEFAPETGAACPISIHMGKRLESLSQDASSVTATFRDGTSGTGDVLVGADGVNSRVVELLWPDAKPRRWTEVICYRGLIPKDKVPGLRRPDGSPMINNPADSYTMDVLKNDKAFCMTYWVRGGELLNVWMAYYEPQSKDFQADDWYPIEHADMIEHMQRGFEGDARLGDVLAMAAGMENPTKWGLYDRDAFETWQDGRISVLGDAAHTMLPTFGQGASQTFEDVAALGRSFELHGEDVFKALLHYERVRHYRATRFQFMSKFLFKHLEPEDSPQRKALLAALNERDFPVFDHEKRAGDNDSWIYAHDARIIGDTLPLKKLGPWDFRAREAARDTRRDLAQTLWVPPVSHTGQRKIPLQELQQHATFDDCWIAIRGKVYDFTEWKDRHPGGPFVARMYAGRDATAEFGDFHSKLAERHMAHFCIGDLV